MSSSPKMFNGVQKGDRSAVKPKGSYSKGVRCPRGTTVWKNTWEVLRNWNIITWNDIIAHEIQQSQKSVLKYTYSVVLILCFRLRSVTYFITQKVSKSLSLSCVLLFDFSAYIPKRLMSTFQLIVMFIFVIVYELSSNFKIEKRLITYY